jgi:hypothetical protein
LQAKFQTLVIFNPVPLHEAKRKPFAVPSLSFMGVNPFYLKMPFIFSSSWLALNGFTMY